MPHFKRASHLNSFEVGLPPNEVEDDGRPKEGAVDAQSYVTKDIHYYQNDLTYEGHYEYPLEESYALKYGAYYDHKQEQTH